MNYFNFRLGFNCVDTIDTLDVLLWKKKSWLCLEVYTKQNTSKQLVHNEATMIYPKLTANPINPYVHEEGPL